MKKDTTIADLIENRYGIPTKTGATMAAEGELANILKSREKNGKENTEAMMITAMNLISIQS